MHQIISFSEIPEQGIQLEIKDKSWFPEDQVKSTGPAEAVLFLARKGEGKVELHGQLEVHVLLSCDRCLSEFDYGVKTGIHLILEVDDPVHHWRVQALDGSKSEVETILLDSPQINIGDILREQVFLALPEKQLCKKLCKGLCTECGGDLNSAPCTCTQISVNSPFKELAKLKKNK